MNQGRIEQTGSPSEIYDRPANRFVADFIGSANLLDGIVKELQGSIAVVDLSDAGVTLRCTCYRPTVVGAPIAVAIRPENIELQGVPPDRAHNTVQGTVVGKINLGSFIDTRVKIGTHQSSRACLADLPCAGRKRA